MSYNCTLYQNTGFVRPNSPDSPSLLALCDSITVPALDIMQDRDLDSIRVKSVWSGVRNADYCMLTNGTTSWFYYILGHRMVATDVCVLTVKPDYLLSAGGVSSLHILDGITERVCVSDDTFGKYKQDDPFLTPAETPQLVYSNVDPAAYSDDTYTLVETTLDLIKTGTEQTAVTYTDPNDSSQTVTVPQTVDAPSTTKYTIYDKDGDSISTAPDTGTTIYDGLKSDVKAGIKRARGIVENPVLKRVSIPRGFIQGYKEDTSGSLVSELRGKWWSLDSGLNYEYSTVKNKRVLYGNYNKYGIITAAGAKCEYNPEDIYDSSLTSPAIDSVADPHLDGKPYYRFETVDGSNDFQTRRFFVGAVGGVQWQNTPLLYTEKAGNALDTLNFDYEMKNRQMQYENAMNVGALGIAQNLLGLGGNVGTQTVQDRGDDWVGLPQTSLVANAGGLASGIVSAGVGFNATLNNLNSYSNATLMEAARYLSATGAFMPEVAIPYNNNFFRDFYGNGAIIYRYRYTDNDIVRLDKILTMYGYKHTKTLELSDFTNRTHFNFVQSSISVSGLPGWFCAGISEQLQGGVRIWHELPNAAAYTDNPIKS